MPPAVIADRVARRLGYGPLDRATKLRIQNAIHYSFGALSGSAYGALAEAFPAATAGAGTAAGAGLYLASHGSTLPLLRIQEPPWRLPRAAFVMGVHESPPVRRGAGIEPPERTESRP